MDKPIIIISHERSGTHLLINIINIKNDGAYKGYMNNDLIKNIDSKIFDGTITKDKHV